jgi:hypothetical protein
VMRNSDVVVSLPGSDVMRGIFLPDGALIILPCRRGPSTIAYIEIDGWQPYSPEAILWLRHLPYIQVAEYCGHRRVHVSTRRSAAPKRIGQRRIGAARTTRLHL